MNKQSIKKSKQLKVLITVVKVVILLVVIALIYFKIIDPEKFGSRFLKYLISITLNGKTLLMLGVACILMPLNWVLEAMKWKKLVSIERNISLIEALKGVVTGLSLGFVTPYAIGDYVGRIGWLKGDDKTKYVGSIWVGNVCQMVVTALFSSLGLWVFYHNSNNSFPVTNVTSIVLIAVFVLILLILFLRKKRKNWLGKIQFYFKIILKYSLFDLVIVMGIAAVRYMVFSIQFLLVLLSLNIQLPIYQLCAGISWIFLFKSIIPSFNFMSDLGIRELSALTFFDVFDVNQSGIVAGSLILWFINILVPVVVGLYFVLRMKILKSR